MNLNATLVLHCTGTSDGAKRAWDTRGRGRKEPPSRQGKHGLEFNVDDIFKHKQAMLDKKGKYTPVWYKVMKQYMDGNPTFKGEKSFPVSKLIPMQESVGVNRVHHYQQNAAKILPVVMQSGGKYYLMDGHHRTVAAILSGSKNVQAEYYVPSKNDKHGKHSDYPSLHDFQ